MFWPQYIAKNIFFTSKEPPIYGNFAIFFPINVVKITTLLRVAQKKKCLILFLYSLSSVGQHYYMYYSGGKDTLSSSRMVYDVSSGTSRPKISAARQRISASSGVAVASLRAKSVVVSG